MFYEISDSVTAELDPGVAKFMDDNGCDVEEACNQLGINYEDAYEYHEK